MPCASVTMLVVTVIRDLHPLGVTLCPPRMQLQAVAAVRPLLLHPATDLLTSSLLLLHQIRCPVCGLNGGIHLPPLLGDCVLLAS